MNQFCEEQIHLIPQMKLEAKTHLDDIQKILQSAKKILECEVSENNFHLISDTMNAFYGLSLQEEIEKITNSFEFSISKDIIHLPYCDIIGDLQISKSEREREYRKISVENQVEDPVKIEERRKLQEISTTTVENTVKTLIGKVVVINDDDDDYDDDDDISDDDSKDDEGNSPFVEHKRDLTVINDDDESSDDEEINDVDSKIVINDNRDTEEDEDDEDDENNADDKTEEINVQASASSTHLDSLNIRNDKRYEEENKGNDDDNAKKLPNIDSYRVNKDDTNNDSTILLKMTTRFLLKRVV